MLSEQELVLIKIVEIFQRLGIDYFIGGSVASSIYGEPRLTQDIDLVADLKMEHVAPSSGKQRANSILTRR